MSNENTRDPFGLPNEDKYDANKVARARYGRDDQTDPEFAPLDSAGYGIGSRDLKKFLHAASEESDPNKPRGFKLRASNGQEIPVQITQRGALWIALAPLNGEWREFHEATYEKLLALLMKTFCQGPAIRPLSEAGRLSVARLCTAGRLAEALTVYLEDRCGNVEETALNDPRYKTVFDEAGWTIFVFSTPDFVDGAEVRRYITKHIGNRPVTLPLLRAAFLAYRKNGAAEPTSEQSEPQRVSDEDLAAMTDEALASLYGGVLRKHGHDVQKLRDRLHGR